MGGMSATRRMLWCAVFVVPALWIVMAVCTPIWDPPWDDGLTGAGAAAGALLLVPAWARLRELPRRAAALEAENARLRGESTRLRGELAAIRGARETLIACINGDEMPPAGEMADVYQFGGTTWLFARDDDGQPVCPQRAAGQARDLAQEA